MPIDAAKAARRRAPHRRDRLGPQGRPALPPRPRRRRPRDRPRRAALHPGVQAARPAQLRHRRGRGLTGRDRRPHRARRRRRPRHRPARRPDASSSTGRSRSRAGPPPTARIAAVYDKGKAAVLVLRTEVADAEGPLWTSDAQIFVRGEGGFGGDRGPSARLEPPDARARQDGRADRPRGPGAALPALRRLEPAARRPRVRQARRLRPADPARAVHVRHDAQGGRRHGARRGRRPGPLVPHALRRGRLPRRDPAHPDVARPRTGRVQVSVTAVERDDAPVLADTVVEHS